MTPSKLLALLVFNAICNIPFDPNKAITRADFAEYIVRALGLYREGSSHENKFKDVMATGDRTLAILIANEYSIVKGYPDGTFRPDALITREEAMTMNQRAMKVTGLVGTDKEKYQSYTDYKQVGSWATTYVQAVLSAHVFNGTTATKVAALSRVSKAIKKQNIAELSNQMFFLFTCFKRQMRVIISKMKVISSSLLFTLAITSLCMG